jgi:hypothetical protein
MTRVVEQSYWQVNEGQQERFDAACKELVVIMKSEYDIEVEIGAVQSGPHEGEYSFRFTAPDGAAYGKFIDSYRTNTVWQEFMKTYSNPPIDTKIGQTERIYLFS